MEIIFKDFSLHKNKSFQINEYFPTKLCRWRVVERILFYQLNSFSEFPWNIYKKKSNDRLIELEIFSQNMQLLIIEHPDFQDMCISGYFRVGTSL